MSDVTIQDQSHATGILKISFERIAGEGRILPTIIVVAQVQTFAKEVKVIPFYMNAKLKLGNETIGQGILRRCGKELRVYQSQETFEIQTTLRALNFVNEQFREDYLSFALYFDSLVNYCETEQQVNKIVKTADDNALIIRLSKIDWLKQVLEPMRYADFALIEFPIPEVPNREQWDKALNHIDEAEAQYRTGNDPGVFSRCYAAYEAIKPIENHLESVVNEDKRKAIKSMFDNMRRFYNKGRHVEKAGAESGEFPVDHRDAEFAIYLVKSSVAYLAKLVHKV